MSPRLTTSSTPSLRMSSATAFSAGRLPWMSETTAIFISRESPHDFERFFDALYGMDGKPFQLAHRALRRVGLRHDGDREAKLGRFAQAFLAARRRAHFARQADFSERDEALRQWPAAQRR